MIDGNGAILKVNIRPLQAQRLAGAEPSIEQKLDDGIEGRIVVKQGKESCDLFPGQIAALFIGGYVLLRKNNTGARCLLDVLLNHSEVKQALHHVVHPFDRGRCHGTETAVFICDGHTVKEFRQNGRGDVFQLLVAEYRQEAELDHLLIVVGSDGLQAVGSVNLEILLHQLLEAHIFIKTAQAHTAVLEVLILCLRQLVGLLFGGTFRGRVGGGFADLFAFGINAQCDREGVGFPTLSQYQPNTGKNQDETQNRFCENGFNKRDFEEELYLTKQEYVRQYKLENPATTKSFRESGVSEEQIDQVIGNGYEKGQWLPMALRNLRPEETYSKDDKGMSQLFSDVFQDHCRYNVTAKEWYIYNGSVWKEDANGMNASRWAKELACELERYCAQLPDTKHRDSFQELVRKYGSHKYRKTMLQDARDVCFFSDEDLDKRLELFNCQNGTYDLETEEFYPHNPNDLLSKCSNVVYDPSARSELFESFVSQVMEGDQEKIGYLQKIFGYALTAETSLETCWILYGASTRNGKSTLVETLAHMMGNGDGYAENTPPETLAQKKNKDSRQASGDIARLAGCRFLNASEPPKRMLFDGALLKTLLGRDSITARHLYQREFEFIPHFKLFINTNYLPQIQDETLFTSGRIVVVPFEKHFSEEEQDKKLKDKLRKPENVSGIFNWCLEGLRRFRKEGAALPESVKAAIEDYRKDSDKLGLFMEECLEKTGKNSKGGEVYGRYSSWCLENGFTPMNKTNFFDELKSKGLFSKRARVNGEICSNVLVGYEPTVMQITCWDMDFPA